MEYGFGYGFGYSCGSSSCTVKGLGFWECDCKCKEGIMRLLGLGKERRGEGRVLYAVYLLYAMIAVCYECCML